MSIEENKAVVQRWLDARNRSDLASALECWSTNNHAWITQAFGRFSAAFPDIHIAVDRLIAEGDTVVVAWTLTGTHSGAWRGIPATGKAVSWKATDIYTVTDGKIASLHRAADNLNWLKQLGAVLTWNGTPVD